MTGYKEMKGGQKNEFRIGIVPDRDDIEDFIKEHGQVSIDEIYREFGKGRDVESFQRELDVLVDKSKEGI
jgi:hypothetical protein